MKGVLHFKLWEHPRENTPLCTWVWDVLNNMEFYEYK